MRDGIPDVAIVRVNAPMAHPGYEMKRSMG